MAKSTYRRLGPDDPIFHGGAQVFRPTPRPPIPRAPEVVKPEDDDPMKRARGALDAWHKKRESAPDE